MVKRKSLGLNLGKQKEISWKFFFFFFWWT